VAKAKRKAKLTPIQQLECRLHENTQVVAQLTQQWDAMAKDVAMSLRQSVTAFNALGALVNEMAAGMRQNTQALLSLQHGDEVPPREINGG
jgi:hypothetical protein